MSVDRSVFFSKMCTTLDRDLLQCFGVEYFSSLKTKISSSTCSRSCSAFTSRYHCYKPSLVCANLISLNGRDALLKYIHNFFTFLSFLLCLFLSLLLRDCAGTLALKRAQPLFSYAPVDLSRRFAITFDYMCNSCERVNDQQ